MHKGPVAMAEFYRRGPVPSLNDPCTPSRYADPSHDQWKRLTRSKITCSYEHHRVRTNQFVFQRCNARIELLALANGASE